MRIKYELTADDIKEMIAYHFRVSRGVQVHWSDVEIQVDRDEDDRTGQIFIRVTANLSVEEDK